MLRRNMAPIFPIEIQLLILEDVYHSTKAFRVGHPLSENENYFSENLVNNITLVEGFLASRTAAPASPFITPAPRDTFDITSITHIEDIDHPLVLRTALAKALPAWRGALRGIAPLWAVIAVPVDDRTWVDDDVPAALQEALDCAKQESLRVLITRAPAENEADGIVEGDLDGGMAERERILQVIALLAPRMAHLQSLRVDALHSYALPLPMFDFVGDAPLLKELDLRSAVLNLPAIHRLPLATPCPLNMPRLWMLTLPVDVFSVTYINRSDELPEVDCLSLYGRGILNSDGPPALSDLALLACVSRMRPLSTLWLNGVHIGWSDDEVEDDMDEIVPLQNVTRFVFEHLSAATLQGLLSRIAQSDIDHPDPIVERELEIYECELPRYSPPLGSFGWIVLSNLPQGAPIGLFLADASSCVSLHVRHCATFPVHALHSFVVREWWAAPLLTELIITECGGVQQDALQAVIRARALASMAGQNVARIDQCRVDDTLFAGVEEQDE